jgi:hypothetical protein
VNFSPKTPVFSERTITEKYRRDGKNVVIQAVNVGGDSSNYLDVIFRGKPDGIVVETLDDNLSGYGSPQHLQHGSAFVCRYLSNSLIDKQKFNIAKQSLHLSGFMRFPEVFRGVGKEDIEYLFGSRNPRNARTTEGMARRDNALVVNDQSQLRSVVNQAFYQATQRDQYNVDFYYKDHYVELGVGHEWKPKRNYDVEIRVDKRRPIRLTGIDRIQTRVTEEIVSRVESVNWLIGYTAGVYVDFNPKEE